MASECVRDQLGTPTEVVRPQPAPSSGVISKGTDTALTRTINQKRAELTKSSGTRSASSLTSSGPRSRNTYQRPARGEARRSARGRRAAPEWSQAVESAATGAAGSSTRGSGWAPRGPASSWEYRAAQSRQARALERRRSRAGAPPRGGHFEHAAVPRARAHRRR